MPTNLTDFIELVSSLPEIAIYSLSLLAGSIEYILPFLPGDTAVVALGAIAPHSSHSHWTIWILTTLASTLGGVCSYLFGLWLRDTERFAGFLDKHRSSIDLVVERFERHGAMYLSINRFIPGLRTFFFIAAAFARLNIYQVIGWGFISSAVWMGLLVAAAVGFSSNIETLESLLGTVNLSLVIIAVVIVLWVAFILYRNMRKSSDKSVESTDD